MSIWEWIGYQNTRAQLTIKIIKLLWEAQLRVRYLLWRRSPNRNPNNIYDEAKKNVMEGITRVSM